MKMFSFLQAPLFCFFVVSPCYSSFHSVTTVSKVKKIELSFGDKTVRIRSFRVCSAKELHGFQVFCAPLADHSEP